MDTKFFSTSTGPATSGQEKSIYNTTVLNTYFLDKGRAPRHQYGIPYNSVVCILQSRANERDRLPLRPLDNPLDDLRVVRLSREVVVCAVDLARRVFLDFRVAPVT